MCGLRSICDDVEIQPLNVPIDKLTELKGTFKKKNTYSFWIEVVLLNRERIKRELFTFRWHAQFLC